VLHYLPDLESDFSVFHRVDDMYSMHGPTFLAFAWRIAAYDGMMARRVDAQEREPDVVRPQSRQPTATASDGDPRLVGLAALDLATSIEGSLFERIVLPPPE
jgi:hypothetical protein